MNPLYIVQEWIGESQPEYNHLIIYKLQDDKKYKTINIIQFNGKIIPYFTSYSFPISFFSRYDSDWKIYKYNSTEDLILNHPELI